MILKGRLPQDEKERWMKRTPSSKVGRLQVQLRGRERNVLQVNC